MRTLTKEQKVAVETIAEAIKSIQGLKIEIGNPNIDVIDIKTGKLVKRYWLRETYFETLSGAYTRKYNYTGSINKRRVSVIRKQIEESYEKFKNKLKKEQEENRKKEKLNKAIEILRDKNKVSQIEIHSPDSFTVYIPGVGYVRFIISDGKLRIFNLSYIDIQDLELLLNIMKELEALIFNDQESLTLAI